MTLEDGVEKSYKNMFNSFYSFSSSFCHILIHSTLHFDIKRTAWGKKRWIHIFKSYLTFTLNFIGIIFNGCWADIRHLTIALNIRFLSAHISTVRSYVKNESAFKKINLMLYCLIILEFYFQRKKINGSKFPSISSRMRDLSFWVCESYGLLDL